MKPVRFYVTWSLGKGTALPMTLDFAESDMFLGVDDEIPLMLQDDENRKFSVIYSRLHNAILMRGELVDWVRNYEPQSGSNVTFELIDEQTRLFRISLDKPGDLRPTDGLYLGKQKDLLGKFPTDRNFFLPIQDLVTHAFICGVTGTGKTVMGKTIIEEVILKKIPAIIVDLKGDLSSLALIFASLQPVEFEPWLGAQTAVQRREMAREEAEKHKASLEKFGLTLEDIERLHNSASFAVFTPKVGKGIPLAIASPLAAPADITELLRSEPNTVLNMAESFTTTFLKTLFPDQKPSKLKKYIAYLQELVRFCWENDISLQGPSGLSIIQKLIQSPPMREIGGMNIDLFFDHKARVELANRVAMCLSGAEQLWFKGVPLEIDVLLDRPPRDVARNTVPVSIINLRELDTFDDQMHAVSHLSYALYHWGRRRGDSRGMPRILFFIDEIGGGGGRNAFFPSHPYDPPSKPGLNLLLRQGRTFGLSCLFATQNPGDVDYKGLSNCQTWMVSRLQTKRDRDKIRQGMSAAEISIDSMDSKLGDLRPGEFLIKPRTGEARVIQQRWLMSYHRTLSESEVGRINSEEIVAFFHSKYLNNQDMGVEKLAEDVDYYDILEVSPKASIEVIDRTYRVLAKKYHPDTASESMSRAEAEAMMRKLNEAYEILSSPSLRAKYDQQRHRSPHIR